MPSLAKIINKLLKDLQESEIQKITVHCQNHATGSVTFDMQRNRKTFYLLT